MGIKQTVITECYCDICRNKCEPNDGIIKIQVNGGDGRDVGPAYINGALSFYQPYGCSDGIVCHQCKVKFLQRYLKDIAANNGEGGQ